MCCELGRRELSTGGMPLRDVPLSGLPPSAGGTGGGLGSGAGAAPASPGQRPGESGGGGASAGATTSAAAMGEYVRSWSALLLEPEHCGR